MHRRLLREDKWRWYFEDICRILIPAAVICSIGRCFIRPDWPPFMLLTSLGLVSGAALLASALAANQLDVIMNIKLFLTTIGMRKGIHTV
jgi:hypothetical protein